MAETAMLSLLSKFIASLSAIDSKWREAIFFEEEMQSTFQHIQQRPTDGAAK